MNLRDATLELKANIIAGNATVLKGPPGLGKTQTVNQLARWYKEYYQAQHPGSSVGLSISFMATQTPIGFTGLPWKGEDEWEWGGETHKYTITDPAIPQWFLATDLDTGERRPANLFHSVLLVLEEWGQGGPEAKRAGAEILLAGGTPPFYLPPGSPRIALTNVDTRDGVTKEYDFIIGRRAEIEITGDVDVWVEDFATKPYHWQGRQWQVDGSWVAFAKQHPQVLFEPKPDVQGPWCNPRSFTAANRYMQARQQLGKLDVDDANFVTSIQGHIGVPAATSLVSHLRFAIKLPSYEDIIADPAGTPTPSKADLQMCMAYELAGRAKAVDVDALLEYMGRLPKDLSITFVKTLMARDAKTFLLTPAMKTWTAKNARLLSVINAIA